MAAGPRRAPAAGKQRRAQRRRQATAAPMQPTSSSSAPARPGRRRPITWPRAGLDVLVLEKSRFPREKVCGDGLTPRAVKALAAWACRSPESDGWLRNKGLRIIGGGGRIEVDWPDLSSYPGYGLVRTRLDFDQILARHAAEGGRPAARGHQRHRPGAGRPHRPHHRRHGPGHGRRARTRQNRSSAAGSSSPPTATPPGCRWRWACASGTTGRSAWRCAPTTPAPGTTTTTSRPGWTCGTATRCCPATAGSSGWATGRATSGLGLLNTSASFQNIDYRALLRRWLAAHAGRVGPDRGEPDRSRCAAPRCRWASTAPRTTPGACCWPATPAGWSTRSTARASRYALESGEIAGPGHHPGPGPAHRGQHRAVLRGLPDGYSRTPTAGTTRSAGSSCELIGKPVVHAVRDQARRQAPGGDALHR